MEVFTTDHVKREFPSLISETGDTRIKCYNIIPNETKMKELEMKNLKLENEMLKKLIRMRRSINYYKKPKFYWKRTINC